MRVITGSARGRVIKTLDGLRVRPTTQKVKEAMFSAIQFRVEGAKVLDLFAGSGQLGIEALSRGASFAVFVDASKESIAVEKENIANTGFQRKSNVINSDAVRYAATARERYDIIFADPPYRTEYALQLIERVGRILNEDGMFLLETEDEINLPDKADGIELFRQYKYGKTGVRLYRKVSEEG